MRAGWRWCSWDAELAVGRVLTQEQAITLMTSAAVS